METLFCIDISVYNEHLTLHKAYEVVEENEEKGQIRIKSDKNRLIWLPIGSFSSTLYPEFELWLEFEYWEENSNGKKNDFTNIEIKLLDGRSFSLNVWTYDFFIYHVAKSRKEEQYIIPPDLFVEELTRNCMEEAVRALLLKTNYDNYRLERILNNTILPK